MKISGNIFKTPMTYNFIEITKTAINIQNFESDYGMISSYAMESEEETSFILSKKDYTTLSMLGEFDLTVNNNSIIIKTKNGKITLANLVDVKKPDADIKDGKQLEVVTDDFLIGQKFTGNSSTQIQQNGVNITKDGYYIFTDNNAFIKKTPLDIEAPVCVPKEVFKYIAGCNVCVTDGKLIAFIGDTGRLFYTRLLVQANDIFDYNLEQICLIKFKKDDLVSNLKLMSSYADDVQIKYNKKIHMICSSETDEFDMVMEPKFLKGAKLNVTVKIDKLLKIIELTKEDEIELGFGQKMVSYIKDDIIAIIAYVAQSEQMEVE